MPQSNVSAGRYAPSACIEHTLSGNRCISRTVNDNFVQFPCWLDIHRIVVGIWQSPSHTHNSHTIRWFNVVQFIARTSCPSVSLSLQRCFVFVVLFRYSCQPIQIGPALHCMDFGGERDRELNSIYLYQCDVSSGQLYISIGYRKFKCSWKF